MKKKEEKKRREEEESRGYILLAQEADVETYVAQAHGERREEDIACLGRAQLGISVTEENFSNTKKSLVEFKMTLIWTFIVAVLILYVR